MSDDNAFVMGSMISIGLMGTIASLYNKRSPFRPILSTLVATVILGALASVAPQVAKGLAVIAVLGASYKYAPDLFALAGAESGSRSGGTF